MKHYCMFVGCDASFPRPSKLELHVRKIHLHEPLFKCSYPGCTKDYTQAAHLKRHVQISHSVRVVAPSVSEKCLIPGCEKTFETKCGLSRHKKHHELEEKFKCLFCSEKFLSENLLEKHLVTHTGKRRFLCAQCPMEFNDYHIFTKHKVQTHATHRCEHSGCENLEFDNFSSLRKHESSVHPVKFSCAECDKQFFRRLHLIEHVSSEHEGISLQCTHENCGKTFAYKRNLDSHVRLHHQNIRFVCTECKKELSTKQKLQEHFNRLHRGNVKPKIDFKNRSKSEAAQILGLLHEHDTLIKEQVERIIQQTCREKASDCS